jgi:putative transposase
MAANPGCCTATAVTAARKSPRRQPIRGPPVTAPVPTLGLEGSGNDVWCIDVVFDTTQGGNTVKFLTIIDEYSHYCLDIVASRRLGARDVVAALANLIALHGAPGHLRCDNGAEFIAGLLQEWLALAGVQTRFIEPASPWQNGINESFNGRFRDECLNRELLANLLEAQCVAHAFRDEYNDIRPHSTIDYRSPSEYRRELLNQAPDSGQARRAGPSLRLELAVVPTTNHNLN